MGTYETAVARRAELHAELKRVERFISAYHDFMGAPPKRTKRRRGGPETACAKVIDALSKSNTPMTQADIAEAIGDIQSNRPGRYIQVLIYRHLRDRIGNDGHGYYLKNAPVETA